jgi:hypothetical protein
MHQTVYIDVDEEITSILDRVRQETTMDIFLVVPKGAMLLDSIINLKLLKKESEKMGKMVSIVAPNDNRAKTMIERAGIKAEDYNQAMNEQQLQEASIDKNIETEQINKAVSESVGETSQQIAQGGLDIGSNSFFAKGGQAQGNNTPGQNQAQARQSAQSLGKQESFRQVNETQPVQQQQNAPHQSSMIGQSQAGGIQPSPGAGEYPRQGDGNNKEISNNYSQSDSKLSYFNNHKQEIAKEKGGVIATLFKNKFLIGSIIAIGIILLGGGGWYIANYPKLTLVIKPLSKNVDKEIKLIARDDSTSINIDDKIIPGEYMEISLEKTIEFDATGSKVMDKNGAKAKGTVTIENSLSDKPQRLVKTTRVLSKDGKIFRLTKDIMVPGIKDDKPGKIEVTVEADKPGKEFNVDKGEFVIAAWKGTPKGEKFKVLSSNAMTGGITSADSKTQKVVSETDLDTARKETLKVLDESLEEEIKKRLNPGQSMVQSSVEKEIISNKASHLADTIANKFTYTVVYKVKVMAFVERDVREIVEGVIQEEVGKNYRLEPDFKIETKRGVVDLDKKTITVYVDVEGTSKFEIDEIKLKESIAGQNSEDTKKALNRDAGIQSAEIKPSPAWSSKAPSNLDKITIEIVK